MRHDVGPALVVALAACGHAPDPGPTVQVTGETTRIRDEDPLPRTSPFFDGVSVSLRAARGETLGVAVWRRDAGDVPVSLTIAGAEVQGYAVESLPVVRLSTAMYGPSGGAGHWPDRLVPVDGAVPTSRVALFDVRANASGTGTLTIGDQTFAVALSIDPIELPRLGDPARVWAYTDQRQVEDVLAAYGVAACDDHGFDAHCATLPYYPTSMDELADWHDEWPAPFVIPIDEPHTREDKEKVRQLADQVHATNPRARMAVTDAPDPIYGDAVDLYISPFAVTLAHPGAWTYNGTPPFAGAMVLDTDGAALRTWGWIGWRWQVPVWYVWNAAYWNDKYHRHTSDLERDAVSFDDGEDHGNLDGVLVYPDGKPSWRLAELRRGLEDRALLELLAACKGRAAAEAIAAPLVPRALGDAHRGDDASWPHDELAWETARRRLLDALDGCAR